MADGFRCTFCGFHEDEHGLSQQQLRQRDLPLGGAPCDQYIPSEEEIAETSKRLGSSKQLSVIEKLAQSTAEIHR